MFTPLNTSFDSNFSAFNINKEPGYVQRARSTIGHPFETRESLFLLNDLVDYSDVAEYYVDVSLPIMESWAASQQANVDGHQPTVVGADEHIRKRMAGPLARGPT